MTGPALRTGEFKTPAPPSPPFPPPGFGDSRPLKPAAEPHPSDSDAAACLNGVMKDTDRSSRARRPASARIAAKPPEPGMGRMSPESPFSHFPDRAGTPAPLTRNRHIRSRFVTTPASPSQSRHVSQAGYDQGSGTMR